nr:unnamed protein product [Digitaria exilis]
MSAPGGGGTEPRRATPPANDAPARKQRFVGLHGRWARSVAVPISLPNLIGNPISSAVDAGGGGDLDLNIDGVVDLGIGGRREHLLKWPDEGTTLSSPNSCVQQHQLLLYSLPGDKHTVQCPFLFYSSLPLVLESGGKQAIFYSYLLLAL